MTRKHILITGPTGFIGSHVAYKFLADKNYQLVAMVRRKKDYKNAGELENEGAILFEGSFCDKAFTERVFKEFPVEYVIHLAALRGGGAGTAQDFREVNVLGTEVLLHASLKNKVKKFIFCSSVGVFGTIPENLPAGLNTVLIGDNEYHNSKILAEEAVQRYIGLGLNAYIIRPTITYGPEDNGFPSTLVNLVRRRLFFLNFKDVMIHLLDVESFAEIIKKLVDSEGILQRVFIAADRDPVILKDLVNQIHHHYYKRPYPSFLKLPDVVFKIMINIFRITNSEKWHTRILLISKNWYYDISETTDLLGFVPRSTSELFIKQVCG
jgi:nucleoside-diphosphate-sugar epimerase